MIYIDFMQKQIKKILEYFLQNKIKTLLIMGMIVILAIIVLLIFTSSKKTMPQLNNLLTDYSWQYFAGATTTSEGLLIQPLNRIITHQDGSEGQPNPPVNLVGPHLSVEGDFRITATIEKIGSWGSLRFYGKPPIMYDQWRLETGSIDIEIATSTITVRVWDGSAKDSIDMRIYPSLLTDPVVVSFEHRKDAFVLFANGVMLGSMPDHNIFASNEVWFGADAALDNEWLLTSLSVSALQRGKVDIVPQPSFIVERDNDSNTLRNLSFKNSRKLPIGAAVAYNTLVTNEEYRKLTVSEFSMMTPENGMKPQFIHPGKDTYTFTEMDVLVDIAHKNDILVHGHSLVYAKSNPAWMSEISKSKREEVMVDHVKTVASHFKGKVAEWDVVNEPLSNSREAYQDERMGLESNFWYEAMGEKYIDLAFMTAREADPEALLFLNEYGLERDGERWDTLISLIKRLQGRKVPIDGIGFESHVYGDGDYSDLEVLRKHMQTLKDLGLKVRISEIDVTGDNPEEQINQYVIALDACLSESNCVGYSTWGVTDQFGSTSRSDRYPVVYGTSLLFDTELKPKPAYRALQEKLQEY